MVGVVNRVYEDAGLQDHFKDAYLRCCRRRDAGLCNFAASCLIYYSDEQYQVPAMEGFGRQDIQVSSNGTLFCVDSHLTTLSTRVAPLLVYTRHRTISLLCRACSYQFYCACTPKPHHTFQHISPIFNSRASGVFSLTRLFPWPLFARIMLYTDIYLIPWGIETCHRWGLVKLALDVHADH